MRRGRGGLTDDDRALWSQVARSVTPMTVTARRKAALACPELAQSPPAPQGRVPEPAPPLTPRAPTLLPPAFRVGASARAAPPASLAGHPADRLREQPVRMDFGTHRELTRGKMRPEARIDLHGMTLAVAKAELTDFVMSSQASGRRLVLVITGKGKGDHGPLPTRSGALRHEVPHWLAMAPLARVVMQVVPAHVRHGGAGAYYVWLRRFGR